MLKRPDFISREDFRSWMTTAKLNRLIQVDGVLASSFLARSEKKGRPIVHNEIDSRKVYRILDITARAYADGVAVEPSKRLLLEWENERLGAAVDHQTQVRTRLRRELDALEEDVAALERLKELSECAMEKGRRVLLTGPQIVAASLSLERLCGVYFLIQEKQIVYVGQSVNVFARIAQHTDKQFDSISFIPCDESQLSALESLYIHFLRPRLNGKRSDGTTPAAPMRLDRIISGWK